MFPDETDREQRTSDATMPRTPATTFFVSFLLETRQTLAGIVTCLPGDGEQLKNSFYAFVTENNSLLLNDRGSF